MASCCLCMSLMAATMDWSSASSIGKQRCYHCLAPRWFRPRPQLQPSSPKPSEGLLFFNLLANFLDLVRMASKAARSRNMRCSSVEAVNPDKEEQRAFAPWGNLEPDFF